MVFDSISYVIPVFNEELNIRNTIYKVKDAFNQNDIKSFEIIFIDDGSTDKTVEVIKTFIQQGDPIKCICLTRNFGHQEALTAGLSNSKSDLIAVLDGDLQDPPSVINEFIKAAKNGYDVIYGVRRKRKEIFYKKMAYGVFYKL